MMRLVRRGLMYGNLVEIASPALVGRYNRALKHLTGLETKLTEFHVDISGYSPEVGDELGDDLYLNPKGCNRQFILLTTDQKTAPLLNSHFSTSRSILRDYIDDNEQELFALTAREAVSGELMNSVFEVKTPKDLFKINKVTVESDTIQQHVAEAKELQGHIDSFINDNDAWWDDVLIAQMIELAKRTGNIQRHPIKMDNKTYTQGNYYTNHFGGIYVFRDAKMPTVIARKEHAGLKDLPIENILTFDDRKAIAQFLYYTKMTELIASRPDDETASILQQKLDFITIATAAEAGDNLKNVTRQNLRKINRKYVSKMPEAYNGLAAMLRWASAGGEFPEIEPEHPSYFYTFRSSQHHDRDLVNMLLADLSPLDFRQLFIFHKDAFYKNYAGWTDAKKDYVSKFLEEEYVIDKLGAREALFGSEPSMDEQDKPLRVDPWNVKTSIRWKQ